MRISNTPYDRIEVGMQAELRRLCTADDLFVFAHASGNLNPLTLGLHDVDGDGAVEKQAPAMWVAALVSAVIGNLLPGPGTVYRAQTLRFHAKAQAGDELVVRVRVTEKLPDRVVRLDTTVDRASGGRIVDGEAEVVAPDRDMTFDSDVPGLTVQRHVHFDRLLALAAPLPPMSTAVVAPEEPMALAGALLAHRHTLITPILLGHRDRIAAAAAAIGADLTGVEMIHFAGHDEAAAAAMDLVHAGRAQAVMKGHLHTEELLKHVVKREGGLRTSRRLSHIFVMDVPGLDHLLMITDAAINITPDLETKADIVQNAIELAHALGMPKPRVGILSAVETVNPKIPSTIDAAALAKMADRGQIKGGHVDGPLAMDNAVDPIAARTKGLRGHVAGRAEILVVPSMEAGNMIAKQLTFLAHAEAAGIVVGALCPVILTSRADDDQARLASCAVAALYANRKAGR